MNEEIYNIIKFNYFKLIAYFNIHCENPDREKYLYYEIPAHFIWNAKEYR